MYLFTKGHLSRIRETVESGADLLKDGYSVTGECNSTGTIIGPVPAFDRAALVAEVKTKEPKAPKAPKAPKE